MPISRTGTLRVKSPRSSAVNTPSNVSTPKFMPPSHYAAAGGYTPRQVTNKDSFSQGGHVRSYEKTSGSTSYPVKGLRSLTPNLPRTPSDSESSILSNLEDHVPDLNELRAIKNGFPGLEAQLLPSLRDTIDRMTGGSSRISPHATGTRTGDRMRNRGTTTKESAGPWRTPTISGVHEHHSLNANANPTRQRFHDTANNTTYKPTPTPETLSRLKTPTKSALKSSLRSPATKTSSAMSGIPESFHTTATSPLKSMKTLLTRKCSGKLRSPFSGHKATADPPQKDPRSHSNELSPPQQERVSSDKPPSSRHQTRIDYQSNIPRFRIKFHDSPSNNFYDDDSDFEHRFDVESRDKRKLIVTNAEVLVSASSSESSAEFDHAAALNSRAAEVSKTKYHDTSRSAPVGLGLSLAQAMHTPAHVSPKSRNEESRRCLNPGKNLRFSLPPSNSGESTYSDDFSNYDKSTAKGRGEGSCGAADADLDFNYRQPTRFSHLRHHGNIQQNDTAYFPNPSRQSPFQSPVMIPGEGNETQLERDCYSDGRRRSSSCGPSFRASPQDTRHMYEEPVPRPRSSCQHHVSREDYAPDREFPQSLKELIKHRNSLSKFHPDDVGQRDHPESALRKLQSTEEFDRKRGRIEKPSNSPRGPASDADLRFYNHPYVRDSCEGQEHWADSNSDNESFRSVATRERLAFGIPPSESDEVFSKDPLEPGLPHEDSDMSSINEFIWKQAEDEMDFNADKILWKSSDKNMEKDMARNRRHVQDTTPRLKITSPTLSSESLTREEREGSTINQGRNDTSGPNFRTTPLFAEEHGGHHGSIEVPHTREGVIQEIFETEEDMLHLLRICMRLFVIPLRVQNSRTWITGVPPTVARQLDWFDDIVHVHEQIYGALCSARDTMSPATDRVSESLRWFVLRIEVYQPYLVRLTDARMEIQGALDNKNCELGQFIRLQEMNWECQGWTFERLLVLPVNRLASYQDLFARMVDLTPKTHQDYLSTLSLSRSTDVALKVMTEVKAREDEYKLLKEFSSRIQGLPTQNHLATRDRRLLHSGPVQLVISNLHELPCGTGTSPAESKRTSRSSKLLDAIAKSPYDCAKSAVTSGSSWITNNNEDGSAVSTSKASWFSRLPLRKRSRAKSPLPLEPITDETAHVASSIDFRTLDVHAFVFSDLVLLVQKNRGNVPGPSWILSEDVGIFRPLSIARLKRRGAQEGMILSLEVATVDPQGLNDTFNFRSSSWRIVDLLLPPPPSPSILDDQMNANSNGNDHFQPWLNSLRQCCKYILRKLTFITYPEQEESSFLGSDRLLDTHLVVSSLTASGLPIPRSPSGNLPETCSAAAGRDRALGSSDEREERGWWSLRYQQVFREFQRKDSGSLDEEED